MRFGCIFEMDDKSVFTSANLRHNEEISCQKSDLAFPVSPCNPFHLSLTDHPYRSNIAIHHESVPLRG